MSPTAPTKSPTLRPGRTTSIIHFKTSGERSARKLPTDMQRKLATCQRRKGRTCRYSQRISEGIHENMVGCAAFRLCKTVAADELPNYVGYRDSSTVSSRCSQSRHWQGVFRYSGRIGPKAAEGRVRELTTQSLL